MQTEAHIHEHPEFVHNVNSGRITMGNGRKTHVYGVLLQADDVLREGDVYSSSNGYWEPCPCPGGKLGKGLSVVWVRPV
jgi:hypothetical protein